MSIPSNAKHAVVSEESKLSCLPFSSALRSRLFRAKGLTTECTLRLPAALIFVGQVSV